ncbi:MAG TPA: calcium-binding protein, partial [Alphaproteobacteria bacterium]|nr:calcium-binding protein [Alphaproteobacteria bacterium]
MANVTGTENPELLQGTLDADLVEGLGGDDTLSGAAGSDTLAGGDGNDELTGGTGGDTALFAGSRSEYTIAANGDGSFTVSRTGESDVVRGVETLQFADIQVQIGPNVFDGGNGSGFVSGISDGEVLDAAALIEGATAQTDVGIDGGGGDDTITGHAGNNFLTGGDGNDSIAAGGGLDFIRADAGNDTVDGGAGATGDLDTLSYDLQGLSGQAGQTVAGNGDILITLDGATLFTVHANGDGSFTVTGSGAAAGFGTDTVTEVETLLFNLGGAQDGFFSIALGTTVFDGGNGNGFVQGGITGESLDAAVLIAGADADSNVGIEGGGGDDTIVGHAGGNFITGGEGNDSIAAGAGFDYVRADAGNDSIDGGGDRDALSYELTGLSGALDQAVDGNGDILITLDGATIFTIHDNGDGSFAVTAAGAAAALFGTDTVRNVEGIEFRLPGNQPGGQGFV